MSSRSGEQMNEPHLIDGVVETVITDAALRLAHEAAEPAIDEAVTPAISKSAQAAFLRAKKASVAQNARSCRIVSEMRDKRECTTINGGGLTSFKQKSIFDYGKEERKT